MEDKMNDVQGTEFPVLQTKPGTVDRLEELVVLWTPNAPRVPGSAGEITRCRYQLYWSPQTGGVVVDWATRAVALELSVVADTAERQIINWGRRTAGTGIEGWAVPMGGVHYGMVRRRDGCGDVRPATWGEFRAYGSGMEGLDFELDDGVSVFVAGPSAPPVHPARVPRSPAEYGSTAAIVVESLPARQ